MAGVLSRNPRAHSAQAPGATRVPLLRNSSLSTSRGRDTDLCLDSPCSHSRRPWGGLCGCAGVTGLPTSPATHSEGTAGCALRAEVPNRSPDTLLGPDRRCPGFLPVGTLAGQACQPVQSKAEPLTPSSAGPQCSRQGGVTSGLVPA